jgi:hypothetical protein
MPKPRSRAWRVTRITVRRWLRRLDRDAPEWMRWLTPWGSSLALHALVLFVLGVFVLVHARNQRAAGAPLGFASQLREDLTALKPSDHAGDPFSNLQTDEPPSLSFQPDPTATTYNVPELPAHVALSTRFQPLPSPSVAGPGTAGAVAKGGTGKAAGPAGAPGMAPGTPFSGRSKDMRAKLVLKEGGTKESEKAVELGLDWIARHQRADGFWHLDTSGQCLGVGCPPRMAMGSDTAATGLALLPMIAAGHTHLEKSRYQMPISLGLKWLIKNQQPSGEIYNGDGPFIAKMYSHAIAAMTLCEAYGITGDKALRNPAQKAIRFIQQSQNRSDGGWRYEPQMPGDTSVFGWQLFALRSASLSGLSVSKGTIARCRKYLDYAAVDPGKVTYSYRPGQDASPVMTAEALLIRQYLGWNRDTPALLQGVALVSQHLAESDERNIYYWYYATQLLHNMKGKEWQSWNERVRDGLVGMQVLGDGCDRGSWDPSLPEYDRWGFRAGRLYTTSLSLLTLEVYYRYLPLYGDTGEGMTGAPAGDLAEGGQAAPADAAKAAQALRKFAKNSTESESAGALPKGAPSANRPRSTNSPK